MRRRSFNCSCCAVLIAIVVGACGGSSGSSDNGVAAKPPDAIVTAASNALHGVSTVHVSGAFVSSGVPTALNLYLVSGKGGRGSMSQNGLSFQLVTAGNEVYINASPAFWRHFGGAAAATLFRGRWLKAPATGQFSSLSSLTNLGELFDKLLGQHGTLTKGAVKTVDGQTVVPVTDTTNGGTLYVATTGKPYPVEIVKTGSGAGRIDFSAYDQPVQLTVPASSIDISQLH
ncbi:MAG: hypothetical protein ACLP22_12065 [Solirubrobacteraceae bacterium]